MFGHQAMQVSGLTQSKTVAKIFTRTEKKPDFKTTLKDNIKTSAKGKSGDAAIKSVVDTIVATTKNNPIKMNNAIPILLRELEKLESHNVLGVSAFGHKNHSLNVSENEKGSLRTAIATAITILTDTSSRPEGTSVKSAFVVGDSEFKAVHVISDKGHALVSKYSLESDGIDKVYEGPKFQILEEAKGQVIENNDDLADFIERAKDAKCETNKIVDKFIDDSFLKIALNESIEQDKIESLQANVAMIEDFIVSMISEFEGISDADMEIKFASYLQKIEDCDLDDSKTLLKQSLSTLITLLTDDYSENELVKKYSLGADKELLKVMDLPKFELRVDVRLAVKGDVIENRADLAEFIERSESAGYDRESAVVKDYIDRSEAIVCANERAENIRDIVNGNVIDDTTALNTFINKAFFAGFERNSPEVKAFIDRSEVKIKSNAYALAHYSVVKEAAELGAAMTVVAEADAKAAARLEATKVEPALNEDTAYDTLLNFGSSFLSTAKEQAPEQLAWVAIAAAFTFFS
jgi:hypothetical protein